MTRLPIRLLLVLSCGLDACGNECGAGTRVENGTCLANGTAAPDSGAGPETGAGPEAGSLEAGLTCGPGTHEINGACVPDPIPPAERYELRVVDPDINADGFSKVPVLAIGRTADGSPSSTEVVLSLSRPTAGELSTSRFALRPLGMISYFTPCSSATEGCLGTFRITMALASDPGTPVATTDDLILVEPAGVGSAAPCLLGGNLLFLDGTGFLFNGQQTVALAQWMANVMPTTSPSHLEIHAFPEMSEQGDFWNVVLDSTQLGQPLAEQVYDSAERWPFQPPNHPGMDVDGDHRGCNSINGRFQIERLQMVGSSLASFTATFEEFCDPDLPNPSVLRGCVHFEQ